MHHLMELMWRYATPSGGRHRRQEDAANSKKSSFRFVRVLLRMLRVICDINIGRFVVLRCLKTSISWIDLLLGVCTRHISEIPKLRSQQSHWDLHLYEIVDVHRRPVHWLSGMPGAQSCAVICTSLYSVACRQSCSTVLDPEKPTNSKSFGLKSHTVQY